ncbi:outer membrane lipoprotein carrier protein LolA [Desulfuromonas thiophila]|uniref:LolA family protein n=1 Tax=Desulfuromonas thiophila TaxID=57664 RepID=UPI0029F490AB|nr:outer membrane lipoprotein carrier protein LolA [Desulfuromonas thiophila]
MSPVKRSAPPYRLFASPLLLLGLFLSLLLPQPAAADARLQHLLDQLQQRFAAGANPARIASFSAEFSQQAHIQSLNRSQQGAGRVMARFNQPLGDSLITQFRWDYRAPEQQQILCDGETLWVYLPEDQRVMISPVQPDMQRDDDPLLFLRSLDRLQQHFTIDWAEEPLEGSDSLLLWLKPLKPSSYIDHLLLRVPAWLEDQPQTAALPLLQLVTVDPNGNRTEISFQQAQLNPPLDGEQFRFIVPPGVDVVHPPASPETAQ